MNAGPTLPIPTARGRQFALLGLVLLLIGGCSSDAAGDSPEPVESDPTRECDTLVGAEPWITLFTEDPPTAGCLTVGSHQDLQIWNKGFDRMELRWFERTLTLGPDDHFATGPIGRLLAPGAYAVIAEPYPMPVIHLIEPEDSVSADLELTDASVGPVTIGMTLAEATVALGDPVAVDEDLAPGPDCWHAVIAGDPYSPIFVVDGDGTADSVISGFVVGFPIATTAGAEDCVTRSDG